MTEQELAERFNAERRGDAWWALCPTHPDKNPSLVLEWGKKSFIVRCYAGCSAEGVLASKGLTFRDLPGSPDRQPEVAKVKSSSLERPKSERVTIESWCRKLKLSPEALAWAGLRNTRRGVEVPVYDLDGNEVYSRLRCTLGGGGPKYLQPKGVKPIPYGLERIRSINTKPPSLVVVEGETDRFVLATLGVPTLGIAGTQTLGGLELEHLGAVERIYVVRENDEAGEKFPGKLRERLEEVGWAGDLRVIEGLDDDVAAAYAADPATFSKRFAKLVRDAQPIGDEKPSALSALIPLSSIKPEEIRYLWNPRIPIGTVTLLSGSPGKGKSMCASKISADVSAGRSLDDGREVEPMNVLMFCGEDDPSTTVRPRIDRHGGDPSRVYLHDASRVLRFDAGSWESLREMIRATKAGLVVFDPLVSYTGEAVNLNSGEQVRAAIQPLLGIAAETQCAILLIGHDNKGSRGGPAIARQAGSQQFVATVRSAMFVFDDPDGLGSGIIAHGKSNNSRLARSLRYEIDELGRFAWVGETRYTADELSSFEQDASKRNDLDEAKSFLRSELFGERVLGTEASRRARRAGISAAALHGARMSLGVRVTRSVDGSDVRYYWSLPDGLSSDEDDDVPF